jgi:hypothetical protein
MMYISRNGRLPTFDENREQIDGREAIQSTHASWDLDMQRMRSGKNDPLHPSFNFIFSMPADTDPHKMLDAVSAVAREHFSGHQYVMVLHTSQTDPADNPPAHPHVHLILRAEDENGRRMHIRKTNLRVWREQFATELRVRGIQANATSRSERGESMKSIGAAEWHIQKRYQEGVVQGKLTGPSRAKAARFAQAAQELQDGVIAPRPWEIAMAARRRDVLRKLSDNVTRLRQEGDHTLADEVEGFMNGMKPLDSERHRIQRALAAEVQERLQASQKDIDNIRSE